MLLKGNLGSGVRLVTPYEGCGVVTGGSNMDIGTRTGVYVEKAKSGKRIKSRMNAVSFEQKKSWP